MIATTHAHVKLLTSLGLSLFLILPVMAADHQYKHANWEQLGLNAQQQRQIRSLDAQWGTTVNQLAPRIQSNERKLIQLMNSENPNEVQILNLQETIHKDKSRLKMEATHIFISKKKVLTPEQQQQLMKELNLNH